MAPADAPFSASVQLAIELREQRPDCGREAAEAMTCIGQQHLGTGTREAFSGLLCPPQRQDTRPNPTADQEG